MSAAKFAIESIRKCLSEAILIELKSWPDQHRQAFVMSHYRGQTIENVGLSLGLTAGEVRQILSFCERKLRSALKNFREGNCEGSLVSAVRPAMAARGGYLF